MIFTTSLALLALPALVAAQYGPPPAAPSGGSSTSAAPSAPSAPPNTNGVVNVNVAPNGQFMFAPNNFNAPNGTMVNFFFPNLGLTHSVTQSPFSQPCTYMAANGSTPGGFDSGLTENTQFSIMIEDDTKPIWFHCKQLLHCGMGMVGGINTPMTGNTFATFQAAAMAIGASEVTETDNGPVTGGVNAIATAPPANTASSAPSPSGSSGSSSSGAGRVVASGVLGLVAAAFAMVMA